MQRLRLASKLWLAILPIGLVALLSGAFVAWSFLQDAESHAEAARSARVAQSTVGALRAVWIEAEVVDATTWGVDADVDAARDVVDAAMAAMGLAADALLDSASGESRAVAQHIGDLVQEAEEALAEVRAQPVTVTEPDRYQAVESSILSIVPQTSFLLDDRAHARELTAAGALAEAARVTFAEEQLAAARPVLNFVTQERSDTGESLDEATIPVLAAAELEFAEWLDRAAASSPTVAADLSAAGITPVPVEAGIIDPAAIPVDRFESVLGVAEQRAARVADESVADSTAIRGQAYGLIAVVGAVLLIAAWAAFATGRAVVRRVRTVSEAAKRIADVDLPNMVDALRNPQQQLEAPDDVVAIDESGPDEVGELARSFRALHTTLIEVAGQQIEILRKGVSDIFVTLARRNRSLVDRQLALIDQLESGEEDPEILGGYYKLDHLATRMRRNAESLLVLAGTESPRVWAKPLAMGDVVRAALGEVDDYQRVDVLALEPARVSGSVVADLAHLMSELLDNATQFSPPTERVRVTGLFDRDGYLLTISDGGVGMSEARLAELNRLLEAPPVLGLALEPTLGMYVVARLAARHDVSVELVAGVPGTTVRITIPRRLLEAAGTRLPDVSDDDELPTRDPLPHTLRTPGQDEAAAVLGGQDDASPVPYAFRAAASIGEEPPATTSANGHTVELDRLADEAPVVDQPNGSPPAAATEEIDAEVASDAPALPVRRRPESTQPEAEAVAGPDDTGAGDADEAAREGGADVEAITRDAISQIEAAETPSSPNGDRPAAREPGAPEALRHRPGRADRPSAGPASERGRGRHRAQPSTGPAPWQRGESMEDEPAGPPQPFEGEKAGTDQVPPVAAAHQDGGIPVVASAPDTQTAPTGPAPAPGSAQGDGGQAGSENGEAAGQDDDWWGPKRRPEPEPSPEAGAAPDETEQAEKLPIRSPGLTFRDKGDASASSSPSKIGASGIRAALTAYRIGRESRDAEPGEDEGGGAS